MPLLVFAIRLRASAADILLDALLHAMLNEDIRSCHDAIITTTAVVDNIADITDCRHYFTDIFVCDTSLS